MPGYRLQKMLGRGGFGEVWQAEGPGRISAAVKIIDKVEEKAGRKEFRALKLIKDLRHPNLVSITGFWLKDADGRLLDSDAYIDDTAGATESRPSELIVAMDLCEKSLLDRLAECRKGLSDDTPGGIPLDELLEYMEAAAKAIDYLNTRHQIQHRDIKPHNIMIVGGSAQVCDFGLASAISTARTSMGGAGSLAYMAPEVYSTKLPSNATDQYSLAITYCELRTGRLPLSDVESFAALDDAKRKGMLDLSLLDERERGPILRATSLDPAARYPACYDMVQELRRAMSAGFSVSAPARVEPIAGYQLERSLRDRDGEQIWEAIDPDGLHVLLVLRTLSEAPGTANWATLSAVRDVSRSNPRLAEVYEFACLSATDKVLPPRLFKLPNPPQPTKTIVAGRKLPANLSERLSLGGMPIKRLLLLLGDLAEALDFLNAPQHDVGGKSAGFQHTNVRPVNFLLEDDRALLSNFAGAQMLDADEAEFAAGKQFPDNAFTPPEFTAGKITRWSDQYMLAVSYLQLRTGKPSASLSSSTGSGKRPDARSRLDTSELKPREREIVAQATDADPRKRFATCREFAAALGRAWDEIIAAEAPPEKPESPKRKSSVDAAAATIDAAAVESVSLSGLRDSAQTAVEPARPAPRHGATLVPSAIETRPPRDTNPDDEAPPQRVADKAHPAPRPKQTIKRGPKAQAADAAARETSKPWWQSRGAMLASVAAVVLAIAIPVALMNGNGDQPGGEKNGGIEKKDDENKGGGDKPPVDPAIAALQQEIKKNIANRNFTAAFDALQANRQRLGGSGDALADDLNVAWTGFVAEQAKSAAEKADSRALQVAAADAALLLSRMPESRSGRASLAAAAQALVGSFKKDLAKAELPTAEAKRVLAANDHLIVTLEAVKPADPQTLALAQLVRARAALRADDPSKAKSTLAALDPQTFADPRDIAVCEMLRALVDEKDSFDLAKLESLESRVQNRLDPWERGELTARIKSLRGGELAKLKAQWDAVHNDARAKIASGGPASNEARKQLAELPTSNPEVWKYLTGAANTADYRAYRGLLTLATLRVDGLPLDAYARALEDLSDRIRVERVADDAAALCVAALERALAIESTLSFDDAAQAAEAQRLIVLARETAEFAAGNFNEHAAAVTEALASADRRRVELAMAQLRKLRDAADFPALKRYAAGIDGVVDKDPAAAVLRTACAVECVLQENGRPSPAQRDALRAGVSTAAEVDKHYVAFVAAISRQETVSARLAEVADTIQAAYTASGPELRWREHNSRKKFVVEAMQAAAKAQAQTTLDKLSTPYYPPKSDAARKSAAWMATALSLFPASQNVANNATFRALRQLQALSGYYANPEDKQNAKQVAAWTDELAAAAKNGELPLQVVLVHARSHAAGGEKASTTIAYARLYDACRQATLADAKTSPTPAEIDAHVLAPAIAQLGGNADDALTLAGEARRAAARLFAASGRFTHLHPTVQARVKRQLETQGSKASVFRTAFDWFDVAVKLDPARAEYYYGRGYSCDLRTDMTYAERAAQMAADASAALSGNREPKDFPAAHGLRGLGLYYTSLTLADYDMKRDALAKADAAYQRAIAGCEALRKSATAAAAYPDLETDLPLLLVGRGFVLLQQANYEADPAKVEKLLDDALKLGLSVTGDTTPGDTATKLDGIHPETAYHLVGNTLEDYGWLLKRPEYYPLALVQFAKAEDAATRLENPAGANLSRLHRGRCRYKLGSDGYLATADVLKGVTPTKGKEAEHAALLAELRGKGGVALKDATAELSSFVAAAGADDPDLSQANAFLTRIRLAYVVYGLWTSDEYDACMKSLEDAIGAAARNDDSPLDRQQLLLEQAATAVDFAAAAKGRAAEMAKRYGKALVIAQALAADEKADGVMRAKGYMMVAHARAMEAAGSDKFRDEIEAALASAVDAARKAQSAENVAAALVQRGDYAVTRVTAKSTHGPAEHDLLVDAAKDYYAAVEKAGPLSADRLRWGRNLALVVSFLVNSKANYPKKQDFEKVKPAYVAKVIEIAGQNVEEYATRFNRQERATFASGALELVSHAIGVVPPDAATANATKDRLAKATKAIEAARDASLKEIAGWQNAKPTLAR